MKRLFFYLLLGNAIFSEPIRSIVLIPSRDCLFKPEPGEITELVSSHGVSLPGSDREIEKILCPALKNEESPKEIRKILYRYYEEQGYPFVIISIPPQDNQDGILQVVVQQSHLGKVEVQGAKYVSPSLLKRYLGVKPGDSLFVNRISKGIDFMQRNPFRQVNAFYTPGQQENTTDIILEVQERTRLHFSAGVDNTGIPTIGRQRLFASVSWDQFFGWDHFLYYQFTTNYDVSRFHSNTFQYTAFFPNRTTLNLYGGFSVVEADISGPQKSNRGTNGQGSLRYEVPIAEGGLASQNLIFGFDLKNTNNTIEFSDLAPTFGRTVNLTQWMLGYRMAYRWKEQFFRSGIEIVASPFRWIANQTRADFESLRPGADSIYAYLTAFAIQEGRLSKRFSPRLSYFFYLQGQITGQTLLPSEQLGLGGYGSVRGYDSRQYNADTGIIGNFELRWDVWSFSKRFKDLFQLIAFVDGGGGLDNTTIPTVPKRDFLIGAGPGVRYMILPYFYARLDFGFKLHHQDDFTGGWVMPQFSVSGNY